MSILTAKETTNLYLYGQKYVPTNIATESIIRQNITIVQCLSSHIAL